MLFFPNSAQHTDPLQAKRDLKTDKINSGENEINRSENEINSRENEINPWKNKVFSDKKKLDQV